MALALYLAKAGKCGGKHFTAYLVNIWHQDSLYVTVL